LLLNRAGARTRPKNINESVLKLGAAAPAFFATARTISFSPVSMVLCDMVSESGNAQGGLIQIHLHSLSPPLLLCPYRTPTINADPAIIFLN
jgi:hypothetical protein